MSKFRVNHVVVSELAGLRVISVAGDEAKFRPLSISVHGLGGKCVLRVLLTPVERENSGRAVLTRDFNRVPRFEGSQSSEDSWPTIRSVDMSKNHSGTTLTWSRGTIEPCCWGTRPIRGHFQRSIVPQPQAKEFRLRT